MASIFQLLRERLLNRAFIILQRQPVEEQNEEEKSQSDACESNDDSLDSEMENSNVDSTDEIEVSEKKEPKSAESKEMVQERAEAILEDSSEKQVHAAKASCAKTSSMTFDVDFEKLYSELDCSNSLEIRCKSALNLAFYLAQDSPDIDFSDSIDILKYLSDSYDYPHLAVSHALLLCAFTKMSMSLEQLGLLEENILSLAGSLKKKDLKDKPKMYKIEALSGQHNEAVLKLCSELFYENYLDIFDIDISTICCTSLCNLTSLIKQHDNELGATYSYMNSTIKYILGMTGKSTQEIVSENIKSSYQKHTCPSMSSYRLKQCLQTLEHALSINPDLSYNESSLHHESFSLPHCLTRLLGWSATCVFPSKDSFGEDNDRDSDAYFNFHLSNLICILKILSVLTFSPNMYDSYTNVKGLMEKILICALKAYFESENNHFDIQVLCLEMLINLSIKNQKTFILLCLKKFRISESEEVLAVEALLKMLSDNLDKIKEVKEATPYPQNNENSSNEDPAKKPRKDSTANSEEVLQAASKDMEHSTIVSFICVLLVFFMKTKQNFKEFILERLTLEALKEATIVSKKFLEFASITGGMPVTGILILTQTINNLQAMQ